MMIILMLFLVSSHTYNYIMICTDTYITYIIDPVPFGLFSIGYSHWALTIY